MGRAGIVRRHGMTAGMIETMTEGTVTGGTAAATDVIGIAGNAGTANAIGIATIVEAGADWCEGKQLMPDRRSVRGWRRQCASRHAALFAGQETFGLVKARRRASWLNRMAS